MRLHFDIYKMYYIIGYVICDGSEFVEAIYVSAIL